MVFYLTHICVCVLVGGTECKRRCFTVWERLAVCDLLNRDQSYFHITVFNSTTPRQKPSSARLASIITGSPDVTGCVKICQLLTCVYGWALECTYTAKNFAMRKRKRTAWRMLRGKGNLWLCEHVCVYFGGKKINPEKKKNFKDCLESSNLRSDFGEA